MAQDTGSDLKQKQEVDLDELEVVILIIGKNVSTLNQAATFLTRRGWPTTVMTNMSKAVEHLAEKKPDFVLVSFNHPNPSIMKLPDLITQTFNLTCVGFVEQMDSSSQARLNNFKMRHKIQGMPSGPNLQRSIRKILAEKFNVKGEGAAAPESKERDANGSNVTVKGAGTAGDGGTVIQSGAAGPSGDGSYRVTQSGEPEGATAQSNGARMRLSDLGGDTTGGFAGGGSGEGDASEAVSNGKYTMSKKTRKTLKDLAPTSEGEGPSAPAGDLLGKLKRGLFGETGVDASANASGEMAAGDMSGDITSTTNAYYRNAKNNGETAPLAEEDLRAVADAIRQHAGADGGPRASYLTAAELAALAPAQLLERATYLALTKVTHVEADLITRELGRLDKLAVFPVDSNATPGYLVLGMEPDPHRIEDFFLRAIEGALREQLLALSVPALVESGFWVHLPEVQLKPWLNRDAGFQIILPHDESEVAMAFFPFASPLVKVEVHGENKDMLKVSLDEISTETPVNFKAYLHLQKNQRYFLYLRNGRQLGTEQKARLQNRKVQDIFMKTVDVDNLRAFRAGAFLRGLIKKAG